jgi:mono/diheme cytochrome c family protein
MKVWATSLLAGFILAGPNAATAAESVAYLYRLHCSGCHGQDGTGSKIGRIPPLAGILGHFATSPEGRLYLVRVPGVANAGLPDAETADVLNYVLQSWGRGDLTAPMEDFSADEVKHLRSIHLDDIAALRKKLAAELARHGISTDY